MVQAAQSDAGEAHAAKARFAQVVALTRDLCEASTSNATLPYWVADDYLRVVALALLGWAWVQIQAAPLSAQPHAHNPARWTAPAAALQHWVLPEFEMRVGMIRRRMATQ